MPARCYIVICGLSASTNLFRIVINGAIFEKKEVIEYKMPVLTLSKTFVEASLILRIIQWDVITDARKTSSNHFSGQILIKLAFSRRIFEKNLQYKMS